MNEIAKYERQGLVSNFEEASRAAKAMAQSGYFSDASGVAQAMVKVLAGSEMGFGPFASMTGIHVIKGKPSVGANLMAAAVKSHPRYNYRVTKMEDDAVVIAFFEDGQPCGESSFTAKDAQKAGTQNMGKFPRNMLFARAMSNGVRWFCPDVFAGNAVYTPDELGATLDDDGDVIEVHAVVMETPEPEQVTMDIPEDKPTTTGDSMHWIDRASVRSKFWAFTKNELDLTNEQVHTALNVEHVRDYDGSMEQAKACLETFAASIHENQAPFEQAG